MLFPDICNVILKKEVTMVSLGYNEDERQNGWVALVMAVIALLFILYMGSSLVTSTREFWTIY